MVDLFHFFVSALSHTLNNRSMHPSFPTDSNTFEYEDFSSESADFLRSDFFMDPEEDGD